MSTQLNALLSKEGVWFLFEISMNLVFVLHILQYLYGFLSNNTASASIDRTVNRSQVSKPNVFNACGTCVAVTDDPARYAEIFYEESLEHIENPERGFMRYSKTMTSSPNDLTKDRLETFRTEDGVTHAWRYFILDYYEFEPIIAPEVYEHIRADFTALKDARFSIIVRFAYTDTPQEHAPYGDADKPTMTGHIQQLSTIFHEFEELITVVQAGFIGTWGEWYSTTHFGDPDYRNTSNPEWFDGFPPEVWADRKDIMDELLANIPKNLTINFRYPREKYHLLNDTTPTVEEEMLGTKDKYRISHHNDCFLSSASDVGTYRNYTWEYPYISEDTQYCTIGGETCRIDTTSGQNRSVCTNAVKEMSELHYTYLNINFNQDVLDLWREQGCFEEIHRNMGYRLVLRRAVLPQTVTSYGDFCFELELDNVGYAAPVRNRDVRIVFRADNGTLYSAKIPGVDTRLFLSNSTQVLQGGVQAALPPGFYDVLLAFTSQYEELVGYSDYNILTANIGTPEYQAGLNNLLHRVEVTAGHDYTMDQELAATCPPLTDMVYQIPSTYERRFCDLGQCQ